MRKDTVVKRAWILGLTVDCAVSNPLPDCVINQFLNIQIEEAINSFASFLNLRLNRSASSISIAILRESKNYYRPRCYRDMQRIADQDFNVARCQSSDDHAIPEIFRKGPQERDVPLSLN